MEKLLEMASKVCDEVELYSLTDTNDMVTYKKAGLDGMNSSSLSGIAMRLIKNGRLGFAYTRNLIDRREFLQNGLDSLKGGVPADYSFPHTTGLPHLNTFDPSLEDISRTELVEECRRVRDHLCSESDGDMIIASFTQVKDIRILNSAGTDISSKSGHHWMYANLSLPGSMLGILRHQRHKKVTPFSDDLLDEIMHLYGKASHVADFQPGRMKALFVPHNMVTFTWRLISGANARNIHDRISPLVDKLGEKVFDDRITIVDDPLNDTLAGARPFDDEGVACQPKAIFARGIFKNYICDLNYAGKLGITSTGNGFRTQPVFAFSDPLTLKPIPAPSCLKIKTGDKSFTELVQSIDRGIIIDNIQGAHSGNIPNGDFSVGVPSGFYVENGEIIGRIKDTMVAGNIYEVLNRVADIGDTLHPCWDTWVPSMLFEDINVSTKH